MTSADIVWDLRSVDSHRDTWQQLFAARCHEPSASFEWTQSLIENHLHSNDRFGLVILKDGQTTCGLVPIVAESSSLFGFPLVTLAPISERYNTHGDMLLASASDAVAAAFFDALFSVRRSWDLFRMGRILEGSALGIALENELRRRHARFRSRVEMPSFILALPRTFEEYLRLRSGRFRNFARRAERKLASVGRVDLIHAGKDLDIRACYAALVSIETRSWKHAHGTAISAVRHQQTFYEHLCRTMFDAGHLHLTLLTLDGQPVAYNLGLVFGTVYYYLKTSFDECLKAHSPSTVARLRLVASLIDAGVSTFDFPGEPYEWEAQWARDVRWHRSLAVFSPTARGRLYGALAYLRDRKRATDGGRDVSYVDARGLKPALTHASASDVRASG